MNVLHADVKMDNFLVTNEETLELKIADFGLARVLGDSHHAVVITKRMGTVRFMAPEMIHPGTGRNSRSKKFPVTHEVPRSSGKFRGQQQT